MYIDRNSAQIMRSRKLKRRRKRRIKRLAAMLVLFVLVAVITLSLTVFFKVETITISGNTHYAEQDIIEKSGIRIGENIILLKSQNAVDALKKEFVYIENARVKKNIYTGTAQIIVEEAQPFCTLKAGEGEYYLISRGGTILERFNQQPDGMYTVTGLDISGSMIGSTLDSEGNEQLQILEEMFSAIENTGLSKITDIDVSDVLNIVVNYDNRVDVEFGTHAELEYKAKYAKEILEKEIKPYERGTLDVSYCHTTPNAVFSPSREDLSSADSSEETEE